MKKGQNVLRCYRFFSAFAWKNNKIYYVFSFLSIIVNSIGPFINILGIRYLIDELMSDKRDLNIVIMWVAFICVGNFLYLNSSKFLTENVRRINENFARLLETELCESCINMKYEYTEDTEVLDMIKNAQRALNETGHVHGLIGPIFDMITSIIIVIGVVSLVCSSIPWLLIPIVLSFLIKYRVEKRINKFRQVYFKSIADVERAGDYYIDELADGRYAKDIRIYKTQEIFNKQYDNFIDKLYDVAKKFGKKYAVLYSIDNIITETFSIVIYFLLGINVLLSRITIGQFSGLYQATTQFNKALYVIAKKYTDIVYSSEILKYYVEYVEANLIEKNKEDNKIEERGQNIVKNSYIQFRDVSFKYPRTERYILKNLSITIKNGEHISLVGENGAGKTTFIKLLCGFYQDYEGEILLNGKDIKDYPYEEYIKHLAIVFQDYKLFAFTLRNNITLYDEKKDIEEIYELSDLKNWIGKLKNGEQTNIYKYFSEDGVEPSGGQGQKIAIARALYKDAPIVILDEPTAAMDPISEYEIYRNFDNLVKNKTAVYISHRLSSCRFCDRIVVFNDGKIVEDGNHDKLVKIKNGFYANMYNTQAQWYL